MQSMELHERLKLARLKRFRTARAASDFLGIPYGTLTGHESGARGVKDTEMRRYARVYGVALPWLRYEDGPMIKGSPSESDDERSLIELFRQLPEDERARAKELLRVLTVRTNR